MRALRWTAASLLGLLGGLLGLVGALLCVTLILLPLGIPILFLSRRLFKSAGQLVVPREVRHPVKTSQERSSKSVKPAKNAGKKGARRVKDGAKNAKSVVSDAASTARDKAPVPGRRSRMDKVRHKLHLA